MNPIRLKFYFSLVLSLLFSVMLLVSRMSYTQTITYLFLIWNLILAMIPIIISFFVTIFPARFYRIGVIVPTVMVWLLFFPNAPYILTDLFHLSAISSAPMWFDLVLILSFAWNGLILGVVSLYDMQNFLSRRFTPFLSWVFVFFSIIAGSFGIYVGRYLRWNSWDVLTNPGSLLSDLAARLLQPLVHPRTYGVTIVFSVFLLIVYLMMYQLLKVSGLGKKSE